MTATGTTFSPHSRSTGAPRWQFPYGITAVLLIAGTFLGTVAYVSPIAAAILYAPLFMALAWSQPQVALFLMFAEVAFPYDMAGVGAHMAPAEISMVLAIPIFWFKSTTRPRLHIRNPILAPILAYFAVCLLSSTCISWRGVDAVISFLQMVLYLVVCVKLFSTYVTDRRQMMIALYGLITSCTFISILVVALRSDSILGIHKNATGTFLSYSVLVLSEIWISAVTRGNRRRMISVLLVVNLAGLIMSTSRGAWMGTAAGLCVLMIARRQWRLFSRALLLLVPAVAACWFLVPAEKRDYALDFRSSSRNIQLREETIAMFKREFESSPVIGAGLGLRKEQDSTNVILSTLAETGVLGLAAFLAIQVCFVRAVLWSTRFVPRTHWDFTFLALGAALVTCLFTHGLVDHYWSRTQTPVWALAGTAIAIYSGIRNRPNWRPPPKVNLVRGPGRPR
jgi:hypothetical protein